MEIAGRRTAGRDGVIPGSVWESRMKIDEVRGGIKVFNGEENSEEGDGGLKDNSRVRQNQSGDGVKSKRKTWKSESPEGIEKSLIQLRKSRSESKRLSDEAFKKLSVSFDGSEGSPFERRKTRSQSQRLSNESCKELSVSVNGIEKSPIQIRKTGSCKELGVSVDIIDNRSIQVKETGSDSHEIPDETCKEFDLCKEKIISTSLSTVENEEHEDEEEQDIEVEIENSFDDVKEISIQEQKPQLDLKEEKQLLEIQEKSLPISENVHSPPSNQKPKTIMNEKKKFLQINEKRTPVSANFDQKPRKVIEEEKLLQIPGKPVLICANKLNKRPVNVTQIHVYDPELTKTNPKELERIPRTQRKLQNIVDLVMWRDVSKSAFVFGLGSFTLLSSSFTKDLNISLISAISYLALLYLAIIFLYRSFFLRGSTDLNDSNQLCMVREEEAIWLVKLILPYFNEFLLNLRSLFSGDPATTMKLAVLLFVLARCGSSITVSKMTKLGFFGVFTAPKICSSYSTQIAAFGKFWLRRFRDAWDSCNHKKAVAIAIFTLVWNLSSVVARIWAVFMLAVGVRYFQQILLNEEEWREDKVGESDSRDGEETRRQDCGPTSREEILKEKKVF